jgi:hypothetical protein
MKLDITFPVPSIVITFNPHKDPEHSPLPFNVVTVFPPNVTRLTPANSLAAVSDEIGDIRLLDTSSSVETGFTTEYIRMNCHDNAIFDVDWSADDMKLVPRKMRRQLMIGNCFRRSNR